MQKVKKEQPPISDAALVGKLYGRTVLATLMTLLVYFSVVMAVTGLSTRSAGYRVYNKNPDGTTNPTVVEEHYYTDGEDPSMEVPLKENQTYVIFRSEPSSSVVLAQDIVCQIMMLVILLSFPYSLMWDRGSADKNAVTFGHAKEDKYRGLRIGLLTSLPSFGLWLGLAIAQAFPTVKAAVLSIFRFANAPFYPAFLRLIPQDGEVTVLGMAGCLLVLMLVPLTADVAYRLGYKQFSIREYLTFKKK